MYGAYQKKELRNEPGIRGGKHKARRTEEDVEILTSWQQII